VVASQRLVPLSAPSDSIPPKGRGDRNGDGDEATTSHELTRINVDGHHEGHEGHEARRQSAVATVRRRTARRAGPARPTDDGGPPRTAPGVRGYSRTGQAGAVGRRKSKNWKTNPSLFKPAWKTVKKKAKNEPIFAPETTCRQGQNEWFWGSGSGNSGTECHESGGYYIARKCVDRGGVFGRVPAAFPPLIWKVGSCL
jgi:hypothetical protein